MRNWSMTAENGVIFGNGSLQELIHLVKARPILYQKKHTDPKNRDSAESAWLEISKTINKPVYDCKRQWRVLRERYGRERRNKKRLTSDFATFVPTWPYFKSLEFLNVHIKSRRSRLLKREAIKVDADLLAAVKDNLKDDDASVKDCDTKSNTGPTDECGSAVAKLEPPSTPPKSPPTFVKSPPASPTTGPSANVAAAVAGVVIDAVADQMVTVRREPVDDDLLRSDAFCLTAYSSVQGVNMTDETFGRYIASSLTQLPKLKKNTAKQEILRILCNHDNE